MTQHPMTRRPEAGVDGIPNPGDVIRLADTGLTVRVEPNGEPPFLLVDSCPQDRPFQPPCDDLGGEVGVLEDLNDVRVLAPDLVDRVHSLRRQLARRG